MNEAGLVFDKEGSPLHWHLPPGRSATALPDSRDLWQVLWDNRENLGGVAHTHPWRGRPEPSSIDVTTFAAVELGLGQFLLWPIITFSEVAYFGRNATDQTYRRITDIPMQLAQEHIDRLRELSRETPDSLATERSS